MNRIDRIIIEDSQTVAEFIQTLKQFPQDLPVRIDYMKGAEIYIGELYKTDSGTSVEALIIC